MTAQTDSTTIRVSKTAIAPLRLQLIRRFGSIHGHIREEVDRAILARAKDLAREVQEGEHR